jgi:2-phosphoglycerate kinase
MAHDGDLVTAHDGDLVVFKQEEGLPYSKGLMAQALMMSGTSPERAYAVSAALERMLREVSTETVTLTGLRAAACSTLGTVEGEAVIARFVQRQRLSQLERPLIVLIGGTTGVGKSTLATQLAHRLGITRVVGTDTIRQVMRAFFAPELMPAIHYSSFAAADSVRIPLPRATDLTRAGFVEQTKGVAVGMNAIVRRAVEESQSMIAEGVHVVPGFLEPVDYEDALILQFVLKVDDADAHRGHFYVREWETGGIRPLHRYIRNFAQIRSVQGYILDRAAQYGVPVFDNVSIDLTVKAVMGEILQAVSAYPVQTATRVGG